MTDFKDVLSKNRTEELDDDVWEDFVIPPFYEKIDLSRARKPRMIIGGRGCGKTMLLRYLSHQSTFSTKRKLIPKSAVKHIGLYWRADTQFCSSMYQRNVPEEDWITAFQHFVAVELSIELLNSLYSIGRSNYKEFMLEDIDKISFEELTVYDEDLPIQYDGLKKYLKRKIMEFESWVNNIKRREVPLFYPGSRFIISLINVIKDQSPLIKKARFSVYLDECENLRPYQKRVFNTWLKHSKEPLIFHLAMKKNSFEERGTLGPEGLSDIHDYRQHDLEDYILKDKFEVFASEILFLQLSKIKSIEIPINVSDLRIPESLPMRKTESYRNKVLSASEQIFPGLTSKEIANMVLEDESLSRILTGKINEALKLRGSKLDAAPFIDRSQPEASIVNSALLFRAKYSPEEFLIEFGKLINGEDNKYTNKTAWVHNNFAACLLVLYIPYSKPCPFYSGISTFCQLAKGNLRHFLELCHKSLYRVPVREASKGLIVAPELQADAAKEASTSFLAEIKSFGRYGNQLYTFVYRLGSLFSLAHQQPSQSEPERSHFSITRGNKQLAEKDLDFISEAVKWSVLLEYKGTKKKNVNDVENKEYLLNPIYAPYFYISYRKKRRLEISVDEFQCLTQGTINDYKRMINKFTSDWKIDAQSHHDLPLLALLME